MVQNVKEKTKASIIRPKEQKSQTTDSSKKNAEDQYGKKNGST